MENKNHILILNMWVVKEFKIFQWKIRKPNILWSMVFPVEKLRNQVILINMHFSGKLGNRVFLENMIF